MGDRMEKVREVLPFLRGHINDDRVSAALAEVEEWEARLAAAQYDAGAWESNFLAADARAEAAEERLDEWRQAAAVHDAARDAAVADLAATLAEITRMDLIQRDLVAERDRLKTLEPYAHYAHSEGCAANGWAAPASPCDCGLDALLARAALGEQT